MTVVRNTDLVDYVLTDPDVRTMLRLQAGESGAFEQILDRFESSVRSYLGHRLSDRQRAEDLTQEVFLRVFRARKTYAPRSKFSTWLFTIVNNVASNAHRARMNRREFAYGGDGAANYVAVHYEMSARVSGADEPSQSLERDEACGLVREAMESLNHRQRTALRLCKLEGMSYAEVADEMRITPEAVKSLLNRARVNLRPLLIDYMQI